jgi:anti-anti-sigma regulatory factor
MNKSELPKTPSQINCAYNKNGNIGVLTIAGILATDCLQEINQRLIDSMVNADFVVVNLDRVTSIDSDCISLFCMASHTAYRLNKRLHLVSATPELRAAASRMCSPNFNKVAQHDVATHCFWLDQTAETDTMQ